MVKNAVIAAMMMTLMTFTVTLSTFGIPYMLNVDVITVSILQVLQMPVVFHWASMLSLSVIMLSLIVTEVFRGLTKLSGRFQTITGRGYRVVSWTSGPIATS